MRKLIYKLRELHWNLDSAPYRNISRKYEKNTRSSVSFVMALNFKQIRFTDVTLYNRNDNCSIVSPNESYNKEREKDNKNYRNSSSSNMKTNQGLSLVLPINYEQFKDFCNNQPVSNNESLTRRVSTCSDESWGKYVNPIALNTYFLNKIN